MELINIGHPFETDALVNLENVKIISDSIKFQEDTQFSLSVENVIVLKYKMSLHDKIYGLGEQMRGINKRGGLYESFATDDPSHVPDRVSLYGAHNFFILDSETLPVGIFIDFPGKVTFDMGFTHKDELEVTIQGKDAKILWIKGQTKLEIVQKFLKCIGPSFLPPKWAFGFQQSRWSYPNAESVKYIADEFDRHNIPLDTIYLDIDYMERYKNFTVDEERFPNFKAFVKEMRSRGIRLIPIIDAGCKIEEDYFLHETGVKNGFYCVDENKEPFVGAVWPGKVHFPDFINPEARTWFGDQYNVLIDQGIEGFWNDMNEPAIFYSEKGLEEAIDHAVSCKGKNLDIQSFFALKDKFMSVSNSMKDYQSFYHRKDGQMYNHMDLHNLYGYNMTRAAGEAFERNYPAKRMLLFSRASYVGMHRYGGIWTGDNHAWWEHLLLNVRMMPSLNMVGFIYSGADVGGFGAHADSELITRWTQFAIFTPLFRNHACMGTRDQEPFRFDEESTDTLRNTIQLRYALHRYLYSEFMKHRNNYDMLFKPLSFVYDDEASAQVEDQLLYGDGLMLAPVYTPNAKGRYVYLPEDMLMWQLKKYDDYQMEIFEKGHHYISVPLEATTTFIGKNKLVVLNKPTNRIENIDTSRLFLKGFIEDQGVYVLYDDDGISREPKSKNMVITVSYEGKELIINCEGDQLCQTLAYDIYTSDQKRHKGEYHV
ncbi:MAG: alpha-glucosidase [Clostridia bacterium]|nr:alpha-glucosidase [Clostridia bacterium]